LAFKRDFKGKPLNVLFLIYEKRLSAPSSIGRINIMVIIIYIMMLE